MSSITIVSTTARTVIPSIQWEMREHFIRKEWLVIVLFFTVDADPHFDTNSDNNKIDLAFAGILSQHPDFNIDLGDTFMSEKLALQNYAQVANNYAEKRDTFGIFGNSVPLYLAIGNHDGEEGSTR
jgi:hypothetical protein